MEKNHISANRGVVLNRDLAVGEMVKAESRDVESGDLLCRPVRAFVCVMRDFYVILMGADERRERSSEFCFCGKSSA